MIKLVDILKEIDYVPIEELVTATKVICDDCGWKWDIADGGKHPYLCKCGHDNTPK